LTGTSAFAQSDNATAAAQFGNQLSDSIVTVLVAANGEERAVGSGIVVRGDGLLLTAYHIVRDARGVKIRLHNGETYDAPEVVAFDQRRNIALLRIAAAGLQALPMRGVEEGLVGSRVFVVSSNEKESPAAGLLSSLSLADEIAGAGSGYRVLKFTAPASANIAGSLLVDERGRGVGLLAAFPQSESQNYAVPFASILGMTRAAGGSTQPLGPALSALVLAPAATAPTPIPIPQRDVLVPQRPVSPLAAKGPGSVVVKPSRPADVLAASKTVFVTSRTVNFQPEHLINALGKKSEFGLLGLSFVDDPQVADLVLTIDHVLFTYKFTFSLAHQRTGVVLATGSVIIWDGNLGAPRMADRVIEKLAQVRLQAVK